MEWGDELSSADEVDRGVEDGAGPLSQAKQFRASVPSSVGISEDALEF